MAGADPSDSHAQTFVDGSVGSVLGSRVVARRHGQTITGIQMSHEAVIDETQNVVIWGVRAGTAAAGRSVAGELADPSNERLWQHEIGHAIVTRDVLDKFNRVNRGGAIFTFAAPIARNDQAAYDAARALVGENLMSEVRARVRVTQALYETITQDLPGSDTSIGPDSAGSIRYVLGLGVSMRQIHATASNILNNFLERSFAEAFGSAPWPPRPGAERSPNQSSPAFAGRLEQAQSYSLAYILWEYGHLHRAGHSAVPPGFVAPAGAPPGFGARSRW
jgi:hypothetical protein